MQSGHPKMRWGIVRFKRAMVNDEVANRVMLQQQAEVKRARLPSAIRSSRNPANEVISVNPA